MTKLCKQCNEVKSVSEFHKAGKSTNGKDRYATKCKSCRSPLTPDQLKEKERLKEAGARICRVCEEEKPVNDFYNFQKICKKCRLDDDKRKLQENPSLKEAIRKNAIERRRARRLIIWDHLMKNPCVDCGNSDPLVLEFDHIDQANKSFEISERTKAGPIEELLAEIAKCEVRCANCHRARTYAQLGWEIPYQDYDWSDISGKRIDKLQYERQEDPADREGFQRPA